MIEKIKKPYILHLFTTIIASQVYAANPSTATVTVTIPALVQISGLSDISLSPTNFGIAVTGNTTVCIYTNVISPLGSYFVTATSANPSSGAFRVANGSNFITYNAFWNGTSSPTQTTSLSSGTKTTQQSGGNSASLTCSGTPNANFNISLSSAQVLGASAATYTDTVTLVISPT